MICLYSVFPAADLDCVNETFNRLIEFGVDSHCIEKVKSNDDLDRALKNEQGILIFPGGNAAFLQWELNLEMLANKVTAAVSKGWNCLGFCAGSSVLCRDMILYKEGKVIDSAQKHGALPTVFIVAPFV